MTRDEHEPPPVPPPPGREPPPATPLDYRPARGPRLPFRPGPRFLAGLAAGAAISLAAWGLGWNRFVDNASDARALLGVPGFKVVAAMACMFVPGWRPVGAGLLVSIALGALIFFGSCLYHLQG